MSKLLSVVELGVSVLGSVTHRKQTHVLLNKMNVPDAARTAEQPKSRDECVGF